MSTCNTVALKYILKDLGIRLFDDNGKKEKGTKEVKEEDLTVYIPETPELQQVEIKSERQISFLLLQLSSPVLLLSLMRLLSIMSPLE